MCKVYNDIDKVVEVDVCLFWKLIKCRKFRLLCIYLEICNDEGVIYIDLCGVVEIFV